jgi:hypothetical protein
MLKQIALATALALAAGSGGADTQSHSADAAGRTAAPEGAMVYFIGLQDGATVTNPVTLHFGARGVSGLRLPGWIGPIPAITIC